MLKNKIFYITMFFLQIGIIFLLYYWNILKTRKMGVVRHITYWNSYKFPDIFTNSIIWLITTLIVGIIIYQFYKYIHVSIVLKIDILINTIIITIGLYYINIYTVKDEFIYYYIIIATILFTVIQFIKSLTYKNIK